LICSGSHGRGKRGFGSQHGHCATTKGGVKGKVRKRRRRAIASLSAWTRLLERMMSCLVSDWRSVVAERVGRWCWSWAA
jgi:hypothetical protein